MTRLPLPFEDAGPPAPPEAPLSVSALTARVRGLLEGGLGAVAVEGEVSNLRPHTSGHIYFTLKDARAQIRAVLFRSAARTLRVRLEDGQHVVARGRVGVYEVRGEYQLICDTVVPHGFGALQQEFEARRARLAAEGLFDAARKRPLPLLPRRIGVVTSRTGAAIRDILRVLLARHPSARVVLRDTRVQGEGAAADLVRALGAVARVPDVDVIILGRGGGSIEDLWAFNDEALARAIAACPVPVIAAVGHESDVTMADFAADVRAATPSNAAEIVVERADAMRQRIDRAGERLAAAARHRLARAAQRLARPAAALDRWPTGVLLRQRDAQELGLRLRAGLDARLARLSRRLDPLERRLDARHPGRVAAALATRIVRAEARLRAIAAARRHAADVRTRELAARLEALSPLAVLARGYAVCWDGARTRIIRSADAVKPGDPVRVALARGELGCRVESTS